MVQLGCIIAFVHNLDNKDSSILDLSVVLSLLLYKSLLVHPPTEGLLLFAFLW